ncbi:uncharacterized protein A1O5_11154 [Cladophialophora psammophila CBS 110553]|uniref:Uncharacterized protein n=1 Tax=Cladophialophora psammophila CBS 110553 TaxID=1182543 RepID=W9WBY5_9EURO|nr:uncharacterized protein A1O5_11154 [Cladophialophora psammophila CBS 110553]EXJ65627.1 hypothetical protein A1O5_11154 [Cladophialophora psammophila CBS 110553]
MSDQVIFQPTSGSALKINMLNTVETKIETLTLADLENPPEETKAPARPLGVPTLASLKKQTQCPLHQFWGSTINFAASATGYPTPGDAVYAAKQLRKAAAEWNSHNVGVSFNWVSDVDDAAFVLAYGGDKEGVLASAFFPNAKVLNTPWVYCSAFDKTVEEGGWTNHSIMKNVFLHELGHVLGLRHEFALDPALYKGGAFRMGTTNPRSVMSYEFPPKIQDSNVLDTSAFYKLPPLEFFTPNN